MKIANIETFVLTGRGSQGAYGAPYGLIVRITADNGLMGYGEADTMPAVAKAIIEAPFFNEQFSGLKWVLLGEDPLDIGRLWKRMTVATRTYSRDGATLQAMAAVDLALWDLKGKALGQPVSALIGTIHRRSMRTYATHPLGSTLADSARYAADLCRRGFTAVKFGWHPLGPDAAEDEAIVKCLRVAIGAGNDLLIDGGMAWDLENAAERCKRFARYDLFWLEEPLPAYQTVDYARLSEMTEIPIAAGEMSSSAEELCRLMSNGKIDILQVDVARVGLTQAMKVAVHAASIGVPIVNHTYSYGINLAASLHFLAVNETVSLCEVQVTPNEIRDALTPNAPRAVGGYIAVPDGPGLGVDVSLDALERFSVRA